MQKGFRFLFFNGNEVATLSTAGDSTFIRKSSTNTIRVTAQTGSGAYVRNLILSNTKASAGDIFNVYIEMPLTNAVIVIKNWDDVAFDGMTFTAGEGSNHFAQFEYDGTNWKYNFGG